MPVTYSLHHDRCRIRTRCAGDTTLMEVLDHFRELKALPSLPQPLDVELDISGMTSRPSLEQLEAAAAMTASLTPGLRWGALAIIVDPVRSRDTSTVYEALIRHYFEGTGIFTDSCEAAQWLDSLRPPCVSEPGTGDGATRIAAPSHPVS